MNTSPADLTAAGTGRATSCFGQALDQIVGGGVVGYVGREVSGLGRRLFVRVISGRGI
jgi:hypothetical protein